MSQYDGQAASFVPGRLRGYREWKIKDMGGEGDPVLALESLAYTTVWPWTPSMRATCRIRAISEKLLPGEPHDPPVKGCHCGIYAKHLPDGMQHAGSQATVMGAIEAWGRVEVGPWGFRAELARISALWIKPLTIRVPYTIDIFTPDRLPPGWHESQGEAWGPVADEVQAAVAAELAERYRVPAYPSYEALVSDFPPIDIAELLNEQVSED